MSAKKKPTKKLEAQNLGPIHDFVCEVSPGMNLLTAANGSGKSIFLNAITRAGGVDIPIEPRDGSQKGKLLIDDVVVLEVTRSKSKTGQSTEVSLASVSPLATVIDPGLKDKKAAEAARIRALVSILNLKTDRELISELVQGDERALDFLDDLVGLDDFGQVDPVEAAGMISRDLHKKKRELISSAEQAEGRRQQATPIKPENLVDVPFLEAQKAYDSAVGDKREAMGSAGQRKEREEERLIIQETLGERPDIDSKRNTWLALQEQLKSARDKVALLERDLLVAQGECDALEVSLNYACQASADAVGQADKWDRKKAILDTEITGATEADVQKADLAVKLARETLEAARESEEYRKKCEQAEESRKLRDSLIALADKYEALAKAVPRQLGGLLSKAGIPSLTVEDGVLQFVHPDGELEPFHRLSAGERTRCAMPIWIQKNPARLAAFPEEFWVALEEESKIEVAKELEKHDVIGITELATKRGDELKIKHFEVEHGDN